MSYNSKKFEQGYKAKFVKITISNDFKDIPYFRKE